MCTIYNRAREIMAKSFSFKDSLTTRKIVLVLILIACLIFIFMQKDSFLKSRVFLNDVKVPFISETHRSNIQDHPETVTNDMRRYQARAVTTKKISMKGTKTIKQRFIAQESRLSLTKIFFNNPDSYQSRGTVTVSLENKNGKTLAESHLDTNLIAHNDITRFSFNGDSEALNSNVIVTTMQSGQTDRSLDVKKGDAYYLVIKSKNVKTNDAFDVYLLQQKVNDENTLTVDGKAVKGEHLMASIQYNHFTLSVFLIFILAIIVAIALILLPLKEIQQAYDRRRALRGKKPLDLNKLFLRIMFFLTPFVSYYIIAKITGLTTKTAIHQLLSLEGALNMMIIGFIWLLVYTCWNRTKYTIMVTISVAFGFGLVNYMLLLFRDSPFIATNLSSVGTAFDVLGTYHLTFDKVSLWAIMLTTIWICLTLSLKQYKGLPLKRRLAVLALLAVWGFTFNYVIFQSDILEKNKIEVSGFKPKLNYKDNGYALSFLVTVRTSFVDKPDNYSKVAVAEITKNYKSDKIVKVRKATRKTPNIICIMDEAYSDLRAVGNFQTSSEYMPFYNSLKENTIKGTMHTSIFGGSTADTEFEYLTGFSMDFLPFHSVPYTNMVKSKTPSLAWDLRARGYGGNIAFHPGMVNSYNRYNVYPLLGFQKHLSIDDMKNPEKIRSYVSDEADFTRVEQEYEKYKQSGQQAPFNMFNVTIQNHSDYKISNGVVKTSLTISDDSVREEEAEQYLNLIKLTDDALQGLIEYFQNVDEPTVIVLFGDHQPRVGSSFYESLYGKSDDELTLEETDRKYQVPFMIWANYNIKSKENVEISANYLSSYLLQQTGGQMTGYNKYLMNLYKKLPVITAIDYQDRAGNVYSPKQKSKYSKLLRQYQKVQYNGFIDKKNMVDDFFYLTK
jgi:hypothetical protein